MQPETDHTPPAQPGWQYTPGETEHKPEPQDHVPKKTENQVSWTASEFIAHQKNAGWYGLLALVAIVGAAGVYLFTRDVISVAMVLIVAVIMGIFAARKPRTLRYHVDTFGVHIGEKSYPYSEFKSFAVIDEGALSSITLMPLKRFMPSISIYYDPADEDRIASILAKYLPIMEAQKDAVDRFMHRIRF